MAMIKCPECGSDISDKAKVCPTCGYKNELYAKKKLKMILPPVVLAAVLLLVFVVFLLRDTSSRDYIDAVASEDYKLAESIYLDNVDGNQSAENKFSKKLNAHAQKLLLNYENDETEYDNVLKILETYKTCAALTDDINADIVELNKTAVEKNNQIIQGAIDGYKDSSLDFDSAISILDQITIPSTLDGLMDIEESKKSIRLLKKDRDTFQSGEESIVKGEYVKALEVWAKISDDNRESFGIQELVKNQSEGFKTDYFNQSAKEAASGAYVKAIDLLLKITEYLDDKEISEKIDDYKNTYTDILCTNAQEQIDQFQFQEALNILKEATDEYTDISIIKEKRSDIIQQKNIYYETRIDDLKGKISFAYDTIDKEYHIVPKGYSTEYVKISRTNSVSPKIIYSSDPMLFLTLGFEKKDWVFMEKIQFSFDDSKTLTFNIGTFDSQRQVIWGGIVEWYTLGHFTDLRVGQLDDLTDLFLSVSSANKIVIRFSGTSGKGGYEHTMTASEKEGMMTMWELNQILTDSPGLISRLTS